MEASGRSDDPAVNKLCFDSWAGDMELFKAIVAADKRAANPDAMPPRLLEPPPTLAVTLRTTSAAYTPLTDAQKFTVQRNHITDQLHCAAKNGMYSKSCVINAQTRFYYEGLEEELETYFKAQGVETKLTGEPPLYNLQCTWK